MGLPDSLRIIFAYCCRPGMVHQMCQVGAASMGSTSPAWFVVRTKVQQETYAKRHLEQRGLTVFLPRIIELHDPAATAPRRQPAALFPGYLFVRMQFSADYHRVIWTPGVQALLSFGSGPVPVADEVITDIRCRCDTNGIVWVPPARWTPGDHVEIAAGPFAGQLGTVLTVMPSSRRIKLLIAFLARQTSVEVPLSTLATDAGAARRVARRSGFVAA